MPKLHQSAGRLHPLFSMTSGAMYSGVPQNVSADSSIVQILAKPKSVSLQ